MSIILFYAYFEACKNKDINRIDEIRQEGFSVGYRIGQTDRLIGISLPPANSDKLFVKYKSENHVTSRNFFIAKAINNWLDLENYLSTALITRFILTDAVDLCKLAITAGFNFEKICTKYDHLLWSIDSENMLDLILPYYKNLSNTHYGFTLLEFYKSCRDFHLKRLLNEYNRRGILAMIWSKLPIELIRYLKEFNEY